MAKFPNCKGLPCGFALCPDMSADTYEFIFNAVKDKLGPGLEKKTVVLDFEQANSK